MSNETRLCLTCGKEWDAKTYDRNATPCAEPDDEYAGCTLDLTDAEAFEHWRAKAHELRIEADRWKRAFAAQSAKLRVALDAGGEVVRLAVLEEAKRWEKPND